ncbi:MAG: hypothetical protein ACRDQZ_13640 [Mycobacteriales bacterium]
MGPSSTVALSAAVLALVFSALIAVPSLANTSQGTGSSATY